MVLNSDEVPDVMEYNKGNATAGLLSTQGLLTDLTATAKARGWDKVLRPSLQTTAVTTPRASWARATGTGSRTTASS